MLVDDIKGMVKTAMKSGDTVVKDILRLALGEIQTAEARKQAPVTEEEAVAALRKLIKSNEETMSLTTDDAQKATLKKEIDTLASLLPQQMSIDDIVAALRARQGGDRRRQGRRTSHRRRDEAPQDDRRQRVGQRRRRRREEDPRRLITDRPVRSPHWPMSTPWHVVFAHVPYPLGQSVSTRHA